MKPIFRKLLLWLHRWTGLTVGLVIVLMAITGAAIVFRPALEPVVNKQLLTVDACRGRVSLDTLAANAATVRPQAKLDYVRIIAPEGEAGRIPAAMVRFTDQNFVYLNPCTGAVLGQRHRYGGVLGTIEQVHRFRFMENGSLITGASAILFGIVLIIGGAVIWWPATLGGLKAAARFNPRLTGPARTLSLHKTVGVYAGLILLLSILTGLPQAFDWYRNGIYTMTGSKPVKIPKAAMPAGAQRLPLEALWQRAQLLVPEPKEMLLHIDSKPGDAADMYLVARDAPHENARTMLYLDAYTGKTVKFIPYAQSSLGHKLYFWTLSWHNGNIGGLFGQLLLLAGALSVPLLAYTGISTYLRRRFRKPVGGRLSVRVIRKTEEAQGICTFELALPDGMPLPPFSAGSHIDVYLSNGLVRQYSLCSDPGETHRYVIGVLRAPASRGGSRTMHDEISEGDVIEIGEPKNHFPLAHSARRSLLVAGGIGVTPILCMAERLSNIGADFTMHYCARSLQRAAFVERIRNSAYADRVSFHFSDGPPEQLVDIPALLKHHDDTHLYVCGPAGFMDVVIDTARQLGWNESNIHREYFSGEVIKSDQDVGFDVKIASTGKIYRIPKDKTVLATLSERGVDIPRSCEQGVCGTCATRVLEGEPDHRDAYLTDDDRARNDQFMPCCSRARSGMLVLDL